MLDAAGVLVDGHPVSRPFVDHRVVAVRAGVACEVPGRFDERVEGIGLAPRILAALRTLDVDELRHVPEWRSVPGELHVFGQHDGQVLLGHRHGVAIVAVDDRDRRAPVALPGDSPVA